MSNDTNRPGAGEGEGDEWNDPDSLDLWGDEGEQLPGDVVERAAATDAGDVDPELPQLTILGIGMIIGAFPLGLFLLSVVYFTNISAFHLGWAPLLATAGFLLATATMPSELIDG